MQKDISELKCLFTFEQIKNKLKELYPKLDEKEINYHAHHVEDVDWLKTTDEEEELEIVIKEQVEDIL